MLRIILKKLSRLFADFWQMSDKVFALFSAVVWPEQQLSKDFLCPVSLSYYGITNVKFN